MVYMKIKFLGVGTASAVDLYNTCFVIENDAKFLLVDGGGGNYILNQIKKLNININDINNIFISHLHFDHLFGVLWMISTVSKKINNGQYKGTLNIFGSKKVIEIIHELFRLTEAREISKKIKFIAVYDGDKKIINGIEYEFIDTHAKKTEMYGFIIKNQESKIVFIGDEPMKEELFDRCKDSSILMHESFCLDSEKDKFNPYKLTHCTCKDAAIIAKRLNAKALIIFHTKDNNLKERKKKYSNEAKQYFEGEVFVPDDLETIDV